MILFGVADPEEIAATADRAVILAKLDSAYAMLYVLAWLAGFAFLFALAAFVVFLTKSIWTARLLTRIEELMVKCEDLTAQTKAQMHVAVGKTEAVVHAAGQTKAVVIDTGKKIEDKIQEVKEIITDPAGPLSQSGGQTPIIPKGG